MIKIYALISPEDGYVFYIGATKNERSRLSGHMSSSRKMISAKDVLINSFNAPPELLILDECRLDDATYWEDFYISLFRGYGFQLLQSAKSGYTFSLKTRSGLKEKERPYTNIAVSSEIHEMLSDFLKKSYYSIGKWTEKAIKEKLEKDIKRPA